MPAQQFEYRIPLPVLTALLNSIGRIISTLNSLPSPPPGFVGPLDALDHAIRDLQPHLNPQPCEER